MRTYLAPVVADHVDVGQEIGRAITADQTGAGEGSEDSEDLHCFRGIVAVSARDAIP